MQPLQSYRTFKFPRNLTFLDAHWLDNFTFIFLNLTLPWETFDFSFGKLNFFKDCLSWWYLFFFSSLLSFLYFYICFQNFPWILYLFPSFNPSSCVFILLVDFSLLQEFIESYFKAINSFYSSDSCGWDFNAQHMQKFLQLSFGKMWESWISKNMYPF